jgi:hypothetical protein
MQGQNVSRIALVLSSILIENQPLNPLKFVLYGHYIRVNAPQSENNPDRCRNRDGIGDTNEKYNEHLWGKSYSWHLRIPLR